MKKNILTLLVLAVLAITYSCNNESAEADAATAVEETEESISKTRAKTKTAEDEEESFVLNLSRKWELGEDFIDLRMNGTFDAILDGQPVQGKWGMTSSTEDTRTLKLVGGTKEEPFNKTYELINVSFDRLEAVDTDGNRINFFAAE